MCFSLDYKTQKWQVIDGLQRMATIIRFLSGEKWTLSRIDDIDPPREKKWAADDILETLEGFGFEWDEEVYYQSKRLDDYQEAVNHLIKNHKTHLFH